MRWGRPPFPPNAHLNEVPAFVTLTGLTDKIVSDVAYISNPWVVEMIKTRCWEPLFPKPTCPSRDELQRSFYGNNVAVQRNTYTVSGKWGLYGLYKE